MERIARCRDCMVAEVHRHPVLLAGCHHTRQKTWCMIATPLRGTAFSLSSLQNQMFVKVNCPARKPLLPRPSASPKEDQVKDEQDNDCPTSTACGKPLRLDHLVTEDVFGDGRSLFVFSIASHIAFRSFAKLVPARTATLLALHCKVA